MRGNGMKREWSVPEAVRPVGPEGGGSVFEERPDPAIPTEPAAHELGEAPVPDAFPYHRKVTALLCGCVIPCPCVQDLQFRPEHTGAGPDRLIGQGKELILIRLNRQAPAPEQGPDERAD